MTFGLDLSIETVVFFVVSTDEVMSSNLTDLVGLGDFRDGLVFGERYGDSPSTSLVGRDGLESGEMLGECCLSGCLPPGLDSPVTSFIGFLGISLVVFGRVAGTLVRVV